MSFNSAQLARLVDVVAAASGRNAKITLMEPFANDPFFIKVMSAAYDPYRTWGLTLPNAAGNLDGETFDLDSDWVWSLLHNLSSRRLTGHAARDAVIAAIRRLEPHSATLLQRIIRKDMRAGFTANTLNAMRPGMVPTFSVMLSKPYEEKRFRGAMGCEPKYDGFRATGLFENGAGAFFTRTGNEMPQLEHLTPRVAQMIASTRAQLQNPVDGLDEVLRQTLFEMIEGEDAFGSLAIDCEALAGSFNKTSGDLRRGEKAADSRLVIFDAVPHWFMSSDEKEFPVPLADRRRLVELLVANAPEDLPIEASEFDIVRSHDEVRDQFARRRAEGLEGVMIKDLTAAYVRAKGFHWMKLKPEETEDLIVVGWFMGEPGTKLESKFAGFIVERDHGGGKVRVDVGGGFKQWQNDAYRAMCETDEATGSNQLIGRVIEVEFHEVTEAGSLRHPRFVRFRDDKKLDIAA